jgi:RimJ/RimL family protein N-acetyltransferase
MSTTSLAPYAITVTGHLDDRWTDWFGDVTLHRADDGTTTIRTGPADQAQLHGLLAALRDLNAGLVSMHRDDPGPAPTLGHPLRTDRLLLRAATESDVEPTWAFRRLPQVNEWLTGCPDTLAGYRDLFLDPDRLATTVVVELDGQVIGDFMLRRRDAWAQVERTAEARGTEAELGWVLDPAHAGHGYATEGVRALVDHAVRDLGVRRVVADCFLANTASWRLMERVGMRRESHAVRESLHRSGRWLDTVSYAVLADEWPVA